MANANSGQSDEAAQRARALARWTNEGGARERIPGAALTVGDAEADDLELTSAEPTHLRVRAGHTLGRGSRRDP